ncbi:SAM-dependent methyltransferase, partial [Frankia sp. AvcI1]|uniref:SAM-dependent methyltransferase n=1 Tax=Frankia sp. AvcI1 TaxID=573496 RepID=UPI0021188A03
MDEPTAVKSTAAKQPTDLNVDQAHTARIYDYFLDGKDNFPADREAAEEILAAEPGAKVMAWTNRAFLARTTRWLAGEVGVRQFLDVGTGIPTSPNLHEIAQGIAPEARVVYVDNDPIVLVHARALLTSTPQGRTAYLDADLRDPSMIINAAELRETLDLEKPVALSLNAILHFVVDDDDVAGIVAGLVAGLPTRSYLVLSHITPEMNP